jgi:hypothetical protein
MYKNHSQTILLFYSYHTHYVEEHGNKEWEFFTILGHLAILTFKLELLVNANALRQTTF